MSTTRSRPGAASSRLGRIPLSSSSAGRPIRNVVRLALHPASRTPVSPNHPIAAPTQDPLADLHDALQRTGARLPDLHRTATMLRHHPGLLRSSLALLEHSDEALADVAERSYLHPNGFAKIVLKVGGGYGIRLHVWHRQGGEWISDANPHGHRWEFASWIVVGALHETTFAELTHGKTHLRCDYDRDERGVGFLTPTGQPTCASWIGSIEGPERSTSAPERGAHGDADGSRSRGVHRVAGTSGVRADPGLPTAGRGFGTS